VKSYRKKLRSEELRNLSSTSQIIPISQRTPLVVAMLHSDR